MGRGPRLTGWHQKGFGGSVLPVVGSSWWIWGGGQRLKGTQVAPAAGVDRLGRRSWVECIPWPTSMTGADSYIICRAQCNMKMQEMCKSRKRTFSLFTCDLSPAVKVLLFAIYVIFFWEWGYLSGECKTP